MDTLTQPLELLAEAEARKTDFRNSLRAAVRGLYLGALSRAEFTDSFKRSLQRHLILAWDEGASRYGISPEDYSEEEQAALEDFITDQYGFVSSFADDIQAQSKKKGGALEPLLARVDIWVNRYDEACSLARTMAGADEPQIWKVNPRKEHCATCVALDGWVKRGSYWQQFYEETGIRPQSLDLICHGYRCGCALKPTRQPLSKGRPPVVK